MNIANLYNAPKEINLQSNLLGSRTFSHPYAYVCADNNNIDTEWSLPTELLSKGIAFSKKVESAYSIPDLRRSLLQRDPKSIFLCGGAKT